MTGRILAAAALWLTVASMAQANGLADKVAAGLMAQGFDRIEMRQGPTQLKVEATDGRLTVEFLYDLRTGQLLRQEVQRGVSDDIGWGTSLRYDDDDFRDVDGRDDDHGRDDGDDDRHDDDDDDRDDRDEDDRGDHDDDDDDHDDDDDDHDDDDDDDRDHDDDRGHGSDHD